MSQRLLEGEVMHGPDDDAGEIDRLRASVERVTRERDAARTQVVDLQRRLRQATSSTERLREQLEPLYRALQGVWGELEEVAPDAKQEATEESPGAKSSPIWESWKTRMPGAPAKIIDALLMHGTATVEQLVVLTQISRKQTIYDSIKRMKTAGIIDKNGGRFSLKKIG